MQDVRPSALRLGIAALAMMGVYIGRLGELPGLALASKPWPVVAMASWVAIARPDRVGRLVAAGLATCAVADVLLDLPGAFLAGVAVFALAHLIYVAAFLSEPAGRVPALARQLPYALWVGALLLWAVPRVGALGLPFAIYGLIILIMMGRAAARVGSPASPGALLVAAGATTFGISDSLIALARAGAELPGKGWLIITLYWAGQAMIAAGTVRDRPAA